MPTPGVQQAPAKEVIRWRGMREVKRIAVVDEQTKRTIDAFQNELARIGHGTSNLLESTNYPLTRLSRNYILMNSLYRTNWIARKVVDCFAEDMMKNWITIITEKEPRKIKNLEKAITATATRPKLLEALKWARLYGGSGAVIVIKGHEKILDKPLDLDDVGPDSYRGLLVFDRWSGISPSAKISTDIDKPTEFGLPETYRITTETAKSFEVHSSRVLRFTGRSLPQWEWQAESRWGISEYEILFDELKKRDNTSWNIASLVFRANIFSLKSKQLSQALSGVGMDKNAQQQFYSMLQAQNWLMSNQGLMVLPEEGGLETHQYGFGGINEVYESFMLDICGASEIPMSRLFGRTYSGLGQTNIGDEHTYYDVVTQKQQRELDPNLQKLIPIIGLSTWGKIPDDLEWIYRPVRSLSNDEQADLAQKLSTPIYDAFKAGIYGRKTALKELKTVSSLTNVHSNITDEMIEDADDDVMSGELGIGAGGHGGGGGSPELREDEVERLLGSGDEGEKSKGKAKQKLLKSGDAAAKFMQIWDHAIERRAEFQGLKVNIENDIGSTRSGVDPDGDRWEVMMTWPYGEIVNTEGIDGDPVDCFLGPNPYATHAFVIHSDKAGEDKVMMGFDSEAEAKQAFLDNYTDSSFLEGSCDVIPMAEFKEKVFRKKGKPIKAVDSHSIARPSEKLSHAAVHYDRQAKNPETTCDRCVHYLLEGPSCEKVVSPVNPNGWCELFVAKS